jgi:hypothetical protein
MCLKFSKSEIDAHWRPIVCWGVHIYHNDEREWSNASKLKLTLTLNLTRSGPNMTQSCWWVPGLMFWDFLPVLVIGLKPDLHTMQISGSSFHPVPNFRTWFQTGYMDPDLYPMVLTRPPDTRPTLVWTSTHNINK